MKKVAVFVEGQAELILVRELLIKMYNYQNVGINCYNLICDNLQYTPHPYGDKTAQNYYMIVNVGNDKQTLLNTVTALLPYVGYPRSLNAISCINEVIPE